MTVDELDWAQIAEGALTHDVIREQSAYHIAEGRRLRGLGEAAELLGTVQAFVAAREFYRASTVHLEAARRLYLDPFAAGAAEDAATQRV